MKGNAFKYIVLLATVSITGVLLIQFLFLRNSYNYSDKQFRESVSVALKEVAWQLILETGNEGANFDKLNPVEIVSNTVYMVNVDEVIDRESLKQHLIEELKKHELYTDFEFAVFNPVDDKMEDGIYITANRDEKVSDFNFPTKKEYVNYFSIHFPNRLPYFNSRLSIWYLFTGLLILVVIFFGYTLSVIIKQRQLSEVQKNFINNLTHELKTPISSIGLAADVLNNKKILDSPWRLLEYAQIIQEQNTRLSKNVEKVLNLASLEKNRIILKLENVELNEFLLDVIENFKQTDYGRKAKINIRFNQLNPEVAIDKFHMSNLITNIVENAVKYCEKSPEIDIQLQKKNNGYELSFSDNGIGISKEYRKKVFKKFFRVPTGNVHNVKGFGLGLDYVLKITRAHKWKIRVDENSKGGSIFTLAIITKK